MKIKDFPTLTISGFLIAILYYLFLLISAIIFGKPVDIVFVFWASDFGNYAGNPDGAAFYNTGVILAGCLLFPFCFSMLKWRGEKKRSNRILLLGQVMGCGAGVGLILGGSFSNDTWSSLVHNIAAIVIFFCLFFTMLFNTIALYNHPKMVKVVSIYTMGVILMDILLVTLKMAFLEWITIATAMFYVVLMAIVTWKKGIESFSPQI